MRRLYGFVGVALSAITVAAQAQSPAAPTWTESEYLLSGLKIAQTPADLPSDFELPAAWVTGLQKLKARASIIKGEAGACLTLRAEARTADREKAMGAYAGLMGARSKMPPEEFAALEKQLREAIEMVGSTGINGRTWVVGEIQNGKEQSIELEYSRYTCDGEPLAHAHTHPKESAFLPSDGDFAHFLSKKGQRASLVVHGGDTCLLLKTKAAEGIDPLRARALHTAYANGGTFRNARAGKAIELAGYGPVTAAAAEASGMGLYCGAIGARLTRVIAGSVDKNDGLYYLVAKGLEISKAWASDGNGSADAKRVGSDVIDFPFVPTMDPRFEAYLRDRLGATIEPALRKGVTPFDFYVDFLMAETKRISIGGAADGLTTPDPRSDVTKPYELTGCSRIGNAEGVGCVILGYEHYGDDGYKARRGIYRTTDGSWERVDLRGEKTNLVRDDPHERYSGECAYDEKVCLPSGSGTLEVKGERVLVGQFAGGKPVGEGTVKLLKEGETWRVRFSPEGYIRIAKVAQ